jgi:hypothetical protein
VVPGLTQPLTEMSTRNFPGGKGRPVCKVDNLTTIYEPTVQQMWEPLPLTPLWAFTACYRDRFTFFIINGLLQLNRLAESLLEHWLSCDWCLCDFLYSLQANPGTVSKSGHDCFLSNPFHCVICLSSYCLLLYILAADIIVK